MVSTQTRVLFEAVGDMGKAVVKPIDRAGGAGVLVVDKGDRNLRSALDLVTEGGTRLAVVQMYLPQARQGDKRVILLGGKPVGAVLRVPRDDDHRANMHVGGTVQRAEIDDNDRAISAALAPGLLRLGLHFVGIDVIGGMLTEVNVTSPTGVQEIDRLEGHTGDKRLSAQVMAYVDDLLRRRRPI